MPPRTKEDYVQRVKENIFTLQLVIPRT